MHSEEEMSEERRLAYVAITRAKEKLFITYTKNRTMYGKTNFNMLSCFVRKEIPPSLIDREMPRKEPPRSGVFGYSKPKTFVENNYANELRRTPDMFSQQKKVSAKTFGIERFEAGTVVLHSMFGEGVIISAKDMGGDVLYEVEEIPL